MKKIISTMACVLFLMCFIGTAQARDYYVCQASQTAYADAYFNFGKKTYGDGTKMLTSTITQALSQCVDGRGDTVYVMAGYSDLSRVEAVTVSKSNVSIVGTGTPKPVLAAKSTASLTFYLMPIAANNVTIKGIKFDYPRVTGQYGGVYITTGYYGNKISECEFVGGKTGITNLVYGIAPIEMVAGSYDTTIEKNTFQCSNTAYAVPELINFSGTGYITGTRIDQNKTVGLPAVTTAGLNDATVVLIDLAMTNNVIGVTGTSSAKPAVKLDNTANTGIMAGNLLSSGTLAAKSSVTRTIHTVGNTEQAGALSGTSTSNQP